MLGYLQERMGVDSSDTAKLGWSRGTYMDTYAPALPKTAILGTHGYKFHENYDPIWRHVRVPEPSSPSCARMQSAFLKRSKCAAAIYQVQPKSALFKLPVLQNPDVRKWMSEVFPVDLKQLQDSEKEPLDLARIQNEALRLSLEEVRVQLVQQTRILERMEQKLERRTALFSPAKGYSNDVYARSGAVNPVWPPIFGQNSVAWPEIFPLIHDPHSLFDIWKPSKSMNEITLAEVWKAWSVGEAVDGPVLGQKPPLRLVEQYFKAKWRSTSKSRKFWERFREIPEWIETETNLGSKSPEASIAKLEALRNSLAKRSVVGDEILLIPLGINAPAKHLTEQRKAAAGTAVDTMNAVKSNENLTSGIGEAAEATLSSIPAKRKAPVASRAKPAKLQKKSK
ncbi:hypothetical protein C8J57DRAFT_1531801 [Mycena rebaudengoi]|nr:hypothetical protein C8J57DRAFT_1531801 [Mycena rebaudengoi]